MPEIIETVDLPEGEIEENLSATEESQSDEKIEFFVQMRGYTQRDMEALVVEAAARVIVGRSGDSKLAKEIEARCIELTAERADKKLATITAEIMDQPMVPSFGAKEPVTMREFLGLYGREYLSASVNKSDGKPGGGYGSMPRMEYLVTRALDSKFERELAVMTTGAIREIQAEIRARHEAALTAEKERVREALAKATT